ncbi:MAG: DsbA family oxidoreductase [Hyphomonadaceae bacterium]|nr:DsbA family oxidoreductase [Hyphomonadaceae bacterium]MBC6411613.1 DsbA family oxidoreductase [Hyphomonadaceae bacterium]
MNRPGHIRVDIVSDIVCPWCWLGHEYFNRAALQSRHPVKLRWRPYMLDPGVPREGVPYRDYMKAKFGDAPTSRWKVVRRHLETAAQDVGITFNFDGIITRPNTLNAHRLIRWAEGQGVADSAAQSLFEAFFKDNHDIGDTAVLTDIAGHVGLDTNLVNELLNRESDEEAVLEEIDVFRRLGVSGVPTFIYEGQLAVNGAQSAETHLEVMEKAASLSKTQREPA